MRARDHLLMVLTRLEEEEEDSLRRNVAFLGSRLEAGVDRLRRLPPLSTRARISLSAVAAGIASILLSLTVAEVAALGSGYVLRFGILLLGIGLIQLLRK